MKNIQETSSSKSDARTEDVVVSPEHQGPFSVLRAWGVPVKRALNDLLSYPLEAVQKAIRIAQNTADAQNPPALYTAALRENWELPAALMKAQDKQRKMVDFQSRLVVSTVPNDVQTLGEQPAPKPINSPLEGLSEAERETLRDEAKRRLGRLLGRPVERIRLDNPLMEGTMMEIAQERNLLVSAPER